MAVVVVDPFLSLADDVPLLLLPVRIETRYALGADPPELRIRILPDQVHVSADTPGAGPAETELTRQFWTQWTAAPDDTGQQAAWRTFVRRVGSRRAGYLARLLQPRTGQQGQLLFPSVGGADVRPPARPTLLPGRWVAVGYSGGTALFTAFSAPVASDLRVGPDPAAPTWTVASSGLVVDDGLAWLVDYERAVDVGMAITVPLVENAAPAADGLDALVVVGAMTGVSPEQAAARLERLLTVHARTGGLAFVPQGTPTNNTETVSAGWTREERELADLAARELVPPVAVTGANASRLTSALGLLDGAPLRRAAFGGDLERHRSRAMLRAAYEAILGTYVRMLLKVGTQDGLSPEKADAMRAWCLEFVTGGAPFACLRIGPQPYGILPVRRSTFAPVPSSAVEHVQSVVSLLIDEWRNAAVAQPMLDPNRIDDGSDDESDDEFTAIATILATQPNPARLFVRHLDMFSAVDPFSRLLTPQGIHQLQLFMLDPALNPMPEFGSPYLEMAAYYALGTVEGGLSSIEEQLALWRQLQDDLPFLIPNDADALDVGVSYVREVIDTITRYIVRQEPLDRLPLDEFSSVLTEDNTALIEGWLFSTTAEWAEAGVVSAPGAPAGQTPADYLADLRDRFASRGATLPASTLALDPVPLLYQVIDKTLHLVPQDAAEEQRVLADLDELATLDVDTLDRLFREALGLGTHRLDAWATALASERLSRLRQARPTGVHIGAFGWVTDLAPRDGAASQGFVHAPSMAHATTAAVLRSGWLAHGTDDPLSPVSVDLRSARVRAASWLLDGVRQGQELGDLLGYRFERALHDLHADEQIREVRRLVLDATGRPEVPPDEPVDGVELLDLHRASGLAGLNGTALTALAGLEDAFDAVNDLALVEAVHQLTTGNHERATALLDSMATGAQAPPELRSPLTPRAGVPVEHRVLVLLNPDGPAPGRGWVTGVRDAVSPALEAWVATLLPSADAVEVTVDGARRTLADLRLSALDAIHLLGDDPATVPAALRTLAGGELSPIPDFAALAIELRRAIEALRVADARDLRPAHSPGEPDTDDAAALDAVDALVAEFAALVDRLDDAAQAGTTDPGLVGRLARFGLATGRPPDDPTAAATLRDLAVRRLAVVTAIDVDPADRRPGVERRFAALVNGRIPVLGRFPVDPGTDLLASLASPDDVDSWLDALGRVRPGLGRLVTAGLLSELTAAGGGLRAHAGQLPSVPGEPWAAIAPPSHSRLSIVAITGPAGPPGPGQPACGLVVDQWTERVPRPEQVTGVAFQYDAPSNRPPQSWLLAVPPDGEAWSQQLVLDTVLETLEWTLLRGVAPEDLGRYGRTIPTAFVPGNFQTWPEEV